MNDIGAAANLNRPQIGFERQRHFGRPTDDEVGLDRQRAQQLEQPRPVDYAGGAADSDNQPRAIFLSFRPL